MAKLTTGKAQEVGRITTIHSVTGARFLWVLRSDRKVLRRMTGDAGTAYTIFGTIKPSKMVADKAGAAEILKGIAVLRGHVVQS